MKGIVFFCLLYFAIGIQPLFAQPEVFRALNTMDTAAIIQQIDAADKIYQKFPDSAQQIYSRTLLQSRSIAYRSGIVKSLLRLIKGDLAGNRLEKAMYLALMSLHYIDTVTNKNDFTIVHYLIGNVFVHQAKFEDAFDAYMKALNNQELSSE